MSNLSLANVSPAFSFIKFFPIFSVSFQFFLVTFERAHARLSTGSLYQCLQLPRGEWRLKPGAQELSPGLHSGWQEPEYSGPCLLPPGVCIAGKLEGQSSARP